MTTVYQDSTIDFFDLSSFYYGCVVGLQKSQADVLTYCFVDIECIGPQGKSVAKESFEFDANGGLVQDMAQALVMISPVASLCGFRAIADG